MTRRGQVTAVEVAVRRRIYFHGLRGGARRTAFSFFYATTYRVQETSCCPSPHTESIILNGTRHHRVRAIWFNSWTSWQRILRMNKKINKPRLQYYCSDPARAHTFRALACSINRYISSKSFFFFLRNFQYNRRGKSKFSTDACVVDTTGFF